MTMFNALSPPYATISDWLAVLYDNIDTGWLTLFALDRATGQRHIEWHPVDNYDATVDAALTLADTSCVWFGVATRQERLEHGRGGAEHCAHIPALWVDIDVEGPGHRSGHRLPPDLDAAHRLLDAFPLPATYIVATGGGLQAWWLFDEPQQAATLGPLLTRWGHTWAELGQRHDWHIDNVFDIARIMRLPGTTNRKTDTPIPVQIIHSNPAHRYGVDDIDQHLLEPPTPPAPVSIADRVPYIGPERPGDAFNAHHTGAGILAAAGWTLHHRDRNGDEHWTRPGKETRQGASATVYADDGHTTIWSDTVRASHPTIELRRPYDPFGLYTHLHHRGDWTASSDTLAAQGYGSKPRQSDDLSWITDPDPAKVITGGTPGRSFDDQYLSVDQLDNLPIPEPLIEGVLNRHSYGLLIGRDQTYKTFIALDWACCLASGKPWQGRAVTQAKVLYVAAEGAYGMAPRVAAWREAWRTEIPAEMLTFRQSTVNLFKPGAAFTDLLERIEAGAYEVVILDTLRRMSGGADGNGSDMGVVVDNIDLLKRVTLNGSVYAVAHTDKGDNDSRGFSGIEDDADIVWHSKADRDDGNDITVKNTKMKDGPSGEVICLRPQRFGDSVVVVARHDEAASSPAAQTAADNRVMTAMDETFALTGASRGDLIEATGLSQSTFYEARGRLLKAHRVVIRAHRIYLPEGLETPFGITRNPDRIPESVSETFRNSEAFRGDEHVV